MKKRIAFVINSIHPGGPSYVVRSIIKNLDYTKYQVFLITLFAENSEDVVNEQKSLGVRVFECDFSRRIQALTKGQKQFEKIIYDNKIDIIHSHGFIPDIMSARLKQKNVKKISTLHNNMYLDYKEAYGIIQGTIYIYSHLFFLKKIHSVACCSQFVYDSMKGILNNICLVRNGIGRTVIKKGVSRKDAGIPENAIVYVYAGQFRIRKNSIWMIDQFKRFHRDNEYLLLIGRGPDTEKCREIVDQNIIFLGFTDNPYAFMNISNVYISASFAEGFSVSVLEALDNGLALFLSDIPSHLEVFRSSERKGIYLGEMFRSGDNQSFSESLNKMRSNYRYIDKNAIIKFKEEELSVENMIDQYDRLYLGYNV